LQRDVKKLQNSFLFMYLIYCIMHVFYWWRIS